MEDGLETLLDKQFLKHFKAFVFVSEWQYERFMERFQLPAEKCYVLKNATQPFEPHKKPEGTKLNLMFHSNPIRGLDILLESLRLIPEEDIELHVFHEIDPDERIKQYHQGLQTYEYSHVNEQEQQFLRYCLKLANEDKRVVRHTRTNNSKVREQLMNTHIFAYPTYFMETSCISMIEALCAGCSVLSSNLAALPETGLGFARQYGFIPDRQKHIERFARELKRTITEYREGKFDNTLQVQVCNKYYSWDTRVQDWVQFSKQLWRKG
jgi:glycosyltransferase involved in cell wall biosynthesis